MPKIDFKENKIHNSENRYSQFLTANEIAVFWDIFVILAIKKSQ
jgi:hypothetical protein